jgi:uncharacterized sulfatase
MKPNVLFFFSDQQRYDTLGCNGQKLNVTPNLDALAKEGVNFSRAYTMQPVCGPARSCLQSGLYPTQTGCTVNGLGLPINQDTLAKRMRQAGYQTAYVGKWHLATNKPTGEIYDTAAIPYDYRGGFHDYWYAADLLEFTSHGYDGYVYDKDNNRVDFKGYRADCITDFALDYLERYDSKQPFFLFISHIEPHHQNDRMSFEGPEGSKELFKDYDKPADLDCGKGDWEEYMPDYLGCCHALDRNLGRVIELLKKKGLYDDTLMIYTSDHGCHFRTKNEAVKPGFDDYKRNSFENTVHIPMVMRGCGFSGGQTVDKMVSLMDVPKTILNIAGAEEIHQMHGRDLRKTLEPVEWDDSVYIQISESYMGRALCTKRYKYVIHAPSKHPVQDKTSDTFEEKYLFDLVTDPLERTNLISNPDYTDIKVALRAKLLTYAASAGETIEHIIEAVL